MKWVKKNSLWTLLNCFAVFVLIYTVTQGETGWDNLETFDPSLASAKWAVRFLLFCLSMTPLRTYFRWNAGVKLRKPAGLWSFGFASLHAAYIIQETGLSWLTLPILPFILLGVVSLGILTALAVTSNRFAMRRLHKNWKRLHRMVYLAGGTILYHAILASMYSKKLMIREPQASYELRIYTVVLAVLLTVRIPFVQRLLIKARRQPQPKPQPVIVELPHIIPTPKYKPQNHPNHHLPIQATQEIQEFPEIEEEEESLEVMPL